LQGSESKYQEFLEQTGLNDETFRREMKMELLVSKIQQKITAGVKVGEEEARLFMMRIWRCLNNQPAFKYPISW
jgi:hypothetical protein